MIWAVPEEAVEILNVANKTLLLPELDGSTTALFGRSEIEQVLPHRDPFLFLDEILYMDQEEGLLGARYDLERGKYILSGHFPGDPMWPGIFQVEAIAQLGGFLHNYKHHDQGAVGVLTDILAARFMLPIKPGADMQVMVRVVDYGLMKLVIGQCVQHGKICSVAALKFYSLSEDWE
jgi:3-hydroxyacyl-[acyl-carrier-protein] dehydratase